MTINCHPKPPIQVNGKAINHVDNFRYFGSMKSFSGSDLKRRRALAWTAFWKFDHLWSSRIFIYQCYCAMLNIKRIVKVPTFTTFNISETVTLDERARNRPLNSLDIFGHTWWWARQGLLQCMFQTIKKGNKEGKEPCSQNKSTVFWEIQMASESLSAVRNSSKVLWLEETSRCCTAAQPNDDDELPLI